MPKKLIEVALPLEEINKQSAREKSIRHGHPSTLHLWWARRPLAACRAVLFSSLVDDPGEYMPDEGSADAERQRLFRLIERLVNWDNITDEKLLAEARLEIARSVARNLGIPVPVGEAAIREFLATRAPPVLDPFAGGGSIPLEAQRLGLRAYASDLNPVAVLINKALIEIPPKFANRPPVRPADEQTSNDKRQKKRGKGAQLSLPRAETQWKGAAGLAEDVRYYGQWMRDEAEKRIGHLYPKVKLPKEYGGGEATVIAWLWARTVKCPNPACGAMMPLARSFWLSTKKGKKAWIEAIIDRAAKSVEFEIRTGEGSPSVSPKISRGAKFKCLVCDQIPESQHIKNEGAAKRMGVQLMAIVAEGPDGRVFLSASEDRQTAVKLITPIWRPEQPLANDPRNIWCIPYGIETFADLFAPRQLIALDTFSSLVDEARELAQRHAIAIGMAEGQPLSENGGGAIAYGDAVATYLAMGVSRMANTLCTISRWTASRQQTVTAFARHALPMTWDFPDVNPFAEAAGDLTVSLQSVCKAILNLSGEVEGLACQNDAATSVRDSNGLVISTDPPYYDNISYADLSDFFYVWLRRALVRVYPVLFATMLVPKAQELIAAAYRFDGNKTKAQEFFEERLGQSFILLRTVQSADYPLTMFYAFKQAESDTEADENDDDFDETLEIGSIVSTGWETMLEGLLNSGLSITGTWPMRSELGNRMIASGTNALASSIVLVCRPRPSDAPVATRREFIAALKREIPPALKQLQQGAIAPVDLAQAAIGPGMAVFSRFAQVVEADGSPMRVRAALALINQALDEFLAEQEGEFDADTRWALAWFEQFGHDEGPYGDAETLSKAKNTSTDGLVRAGILQARAGKVRLLRREELDPDWSPETDERKAIWEATQYLIRALDAGGESAAASLLKRLGSTGEIARDLAYRLYAICERKGWASEALAYNMLAAAWPRLVELAGRGEVRQEELL